MLIKREHILKTLSTTLDVIADNVMITDAKGVIVYVNPAFESITGFSRKESVGMNPRILKSGAHDKDYYKRLWSTILKGDVFKATTTNKKKNGEIFYIDQTVSPVTDEKGEIVYFISVWKDVTERIQLEKKMNQLNEQLQVEKNKLEQILGIEDGLHNIIEFNKLMDFVVEKTAEALEVKVCTIMFIDPDLNELCLKSYKGIDGHKASHKLLKMGDHIEKLIEFHCGTKNCGNGSRKNSQIIDGTIFLSDRFLSAPIDLKDGIIGIINVSDKRSEGSARFQSLDLKILLMIVRQIKIAIENARLYRDLKYASMTDGLTEVYNYRYLTQTLEQEIARAKRYARNLSFLMIDVDQLKDYNDAFGHVEGDVLIKLIASALKKNLRAADIVCRYAGDEFAVILPETDLDQAKIIAEKIRKIVSQLTMKKQVTISIGIAQYHLNENRHDLIRRADSHLYEAKQKGKNRISG